MLVCLFNNIFLQGGPGAGEEEEGGSEFGTALAPAQVGLIGFEEGKAVAVVAVTLTIIRKIISVCGILFIEYIFVSLFGGILQTVIGGFAASFAVILSNFSGDIGDIIDYINGYNFTANC